LLRQIAHFLGVDHCGHTFGPNNNEMKSKLDQMDKMVRQTVDALRAEYGLNGTLGEKTNVADIPHVSTFVTLMGDHGMTALGNHGGASDEERFAGFFSWATPAAVSVHCYPAAIARCRASQLWNNVAGFDPFPNFKNRTEARVMAQIDIVPSISLLMGLPIPYSNFGGVSPELFTLPQVTQSFFEIEFAAAQSRTWEKFKCNEDSNRLECAPIVFAVRWGRHPLSQALLVNSAQASFINISTSYRK
jgi:phosphatidylinositol glycan class O